MNPGDNINEVGSISSSQYREEVRNAILAAKTPLELTAVRAAEYVDGDLSRMFPAKRAEILDVKEASTDDGPPSSKKPRVSGSLNFSFYTLFGPSLKISFDPDSIFL